MEPVTSAAEARSPPASQAFSNEPPSPPNPSVDSGIIPPIASPDKNAPSPPDDERWDVFEVRPETAMKMLCRSVQALASATGDVLPTPPISRPATPGKSDEGKENRRRSLSRPATPVRSDDLKSPLFQELVVGSPVASFSEPAVRDIGADAEPVRVQQEAIARKFFSKTAPPIPLEEYLMRLQRFCPMSTAVYLAAGVYIYKLGVEDKLVPITSRTVHRLVLASLRVAMKALEDLRYPQDRFAGVGGVRQHELQMLEISICYLTNFELQVDTDKLYQKTLALQQAAQKASVLHRKLPSGFQPRSPMRQKASA